MTTAVKTKGGFKNAFKNDETFGTLDLKTLVYIILTVTFFQLGENVSSGFAFVAAGIMLVGLLIINPDQMAFAYIVLSASNRLLTLGNTIPLLPLVTIVYVAREYFLTNDHKKMRIDSGMMSILAVYSLYTLRYIFFNYYISPFIKTLKLFFAFIMLIDVFRKCTSKDEARVKFNQMAFYMSLGLTVTVLIALIFSSQAESLGRFSISENSGANILGIYVSSAIALSVIVVMSDNTALFKRIMALMVIPMLYIGLLTQSRTFVILMIITTLWFFGLGFGDVSSRNITTLFVVSAATLIALFMIFGKNTNLYELFDTIIDRFLHPRHDDVTGGRTRLAKAYLTTIFGNAKYLIFGSDGSLPSPGGGVVAHNMIIEVLYAHGLVGTALVAAVYIALSKRIVASFKALGFSASFAGALPLVICLSGGMASHTILGAMPTNEFFVGICSIYYFHDSSLRRKRTRATPIRTYQKDRAKRLSEVQGEKR